MIKHVEGPYFKRVLMTYEKYRPRHQSMTFEEVISEFLEDLPIESESVYQRFEHSGRDKRLYTYPRHAVTRYPFTCLEPLDSQMPVSVNWPPNLQRLLLFDFHANTMPTTTIGPLTRYVFIFMLLVRHLYATSTSMLMVSMY